METVDRDILFCNSAFSVTVCFAGILAYIVTVRAEKWPYFCKAVFPRSAQGHAYRIKPCKVRCNSFFYELLFFVFA